MQKCLVVTAALLAAWPACGFAKSETISIFGGKLPPGVQLGERSPPTERVVDVCRAAVTRVHILITGLPENWSAGAGQCHTAALGDYPKLNFQFTYGVDLSSKLLLSAGYGFYPDMYGPPSVQLCRGPAGGVESFNVSIFLHLNSEIGGLLSEGVTVSNASRQVGSSNATSSEINGGKIYGCSYTSNVRNKIDIIN